MSTYLQIIYQIVFSTRNQENTLDKANSLELYKYISGILKNKNRHPYCIEGVSNHLHIVTHLHPTIALSALVKDIKLASSAFISSNNLFSRFNGWQSGYGAFTYASDAKENLIKYVNNQETHHKQKSFKEEFIDLLTEHGIDYEDRFLFK